MKKILFSILIAASASAGFSSCMNGDYDANPGGVVNGNNPLNPPGSGGGGGGGSFNWNGTDPMSAKVDGNAWQAASTTYVPSIMGFPASVTGTGPNNTAILINIPDNAAANSVTSFGSSVTASWSANTVGGNPNDVYGAALGSGGSVQILENDATHVKGKFFFNAKNSSGTAVNVTEGYFTATK